MTGFVNVWHPREHRERLKTEGMLSYSFLSCGSSLTVLETPVAPVEKEINGYQTKEYEIHPDHPIIVVKSLVDDAENITELDEEHEEQTLSFRGLRANRLEDRERPRKSKTK